MCQYWHKQQDFADGHTCHCTWSTWLYLVYMLVDTSPSVLKWTCHDNQRSCSSWNGPCVNLPCPFPLASGDRAVSLLVAFLLPSRVGEPHVSSSSTPRREDSFGLMRACWGKQVGGRGSGRSEARRRRATQHILNDCSHTCS